MQLTVTSDDPQAEDVKQLLARHLAFCRGETPAEHAFALDLAGLLDPGVKFFSCRAEGTLLGVAALKRLDAGHAELKSMHTAAEARRRGAARALLQHILNVAVQDGFRRVSLETGTTEVFAPARALYEAAGFVPCGPFGDYQPSPYNTFMTIVL